MTTIRQAGLDDEEAARTILDEYNEVLGIVLRDDRAALRRYLQGPGALWLARDADVIVGCVALRPLPSLGPDACEIKRLYVRPTHRGTGIAGVLLDDLEAHARTRGYRAAYLDTHDGMVAAVRFYARRGYKRIARYNDNPQCTMHLHRLL